MDAMVDSAMAGSRSCTLHARTLTHTSRASASHTRSRAKPMARLSSRTGAIAARSGWIWLPYCCCARSNSPALTLSSRMVSVSSAARVSTR
ncbi:hypothetical protein [Altericista sp. CCNU0014]|uniref:hypothetical protein n=1 Tax=Altericista sp. CCNU0014 TaxID=3082949 RepID=UPI00384D7E88